MRHTLTLEPDVDAALSELCRSTGKPFKELVNVLLRQGLAVREKSGTLPPLKIRPLKMRVRPGISIDSISALEALVEEENLR